MKISKKIDEEDALPDFNFDLHETLAPVMNEMPSADDGSNTITSEL